MNRNENHATQASDTGDVGKSRTLPLSFIAAVTQGLWEMLKRPEGPGRGKSNAFSLRYSDCGEREALPNRLVQTGTESATGDTQPPPVGPKSRRGIEIVVSGRAAGPVCKAMVW
jgi:hypothetical protein